MKKSTLNLIIDVFLLILMMAIIGIGILVKYVLLTGHEKWDKFGENFEFSFLGLDRHDWGEIHFILGIVLVSLLFIHILLHWTMIVCVSKNLIKNKKTRILITLSLLIISISFIITPLFIKPKIEDPVFNKRNLFATSSEQIKYIHNNSLQLSNIQKTKPKNMHHRSISTIEVNGQMSLLGVSKKYDVPVDHLKKALNLPPSTSSNERLGRLRKILGFNMSEIEQIIIRYQKEN